MEERVKLGTKVVFIQGPEEISGVVSDSSVLPEGKIWVLGDIIIKWETGQASTYDADFIEEMCRVEEGA